MNQEKIGKFIMVCRKDKNLTQGQLASKLGVTEKSVSNWENGRNMPDLSLFKPLCAVLDITINELLSGEKLAKDNYQEKFEENVVNTIKYTQKGSAKQVIAIIVMTGGLLIALFSTVLFAASPWSGIISILGIMAFLLGLILATSNFSLKNRIIIPILLTVVVSASLLGIDYINVLLDRSWVPIYRINTFDADGITVYDTLFYDVYVCPRSLIDDNRRVFYPDIYKDTKKSYITKNRKFTRDLAYAFCNQKAEERLNYLFNKLEDTKYIVIAKSVDLLSDDKDFTTDFLYHKYEIVKKIDNLSDIEKIIKQFSTSKYVRLSTSLGYNYLFHFYDKDNYMLAEANYGEVYDGNEVFSIVLNQEVKDSLNEYFN